MCDHTQSSDPTHPQFWHNYLPNQELIENPPKFQVFFKKIGE